MLLTSSLQVRAICVISDDEFATSSRDKSIKVWRRAASSAAASDVGSSSSNRFSSSREFTLHRTLVGHSSFVGPLAWLPSAASDASSASWSSQSSSGYLVSGGMDNLVIVWDVEKGEVKHRLEGHKQQVTSLAVTEQGDIVSASVDQ